MPKHIVVMSLFLFFTSCNTPQLADPMKVGKCVDVPAKIHYGSYKSADDQECEWRGKKFYCKRDRTFFYDIIWTCNLMEPQSNP